VAGKLTRREMLKRGVLAGAALSIPFIHYRFAHAAGEIDPATSRKFGAKLRGRLILPGDPQYNSARKIWNPRYDKRPDMIVRCATTEDVARSIEFARKKDLAVSIRAGGHDQAGFSTNDGGMVIDLRSLKEIQVDRTRKTVTAGGGVLVGELYRAVAASGMGVVSGGCHSVGIGGLTLGGGQSFLSSKYGLACDNVLSMQVVTADARVLSTSENEHPDLFWALRGGSGNFGVVTRFEYRLVPVNRVIAGAVTYPIAKRRETLRFFREFIATAPDELTGGAAFGFPLPVDTLAIAVAYCGSAKNAETILKPLRSFGPPLADSVKEVSFVEGVSEEEPPRLANYEKDGLFSPLTDEMINAFCEGVENPPSIYQAGVYELHGEACRGTSAYPVRKPTFDSYTWGFWRSASERVRTIAWVDQLWSGIAEYADGAYVNDLDANEGEARIRGAYGASYDRLVALKNKYDPTNFFHLNQNIKPTAA